MVLNKEVQVELLCRLLMQQLQLLNLEHKTYKLVDHTVNLRLLITLSCSQVLNCKGRSST